MSNIDPNILARMRKEEAYLQSQSRGSRRVKIEKGQCWTVRFLPSRFGKGEMWYARLAQHWLNKVPIFCPKHTGEDFGGSIDFDCPVCRVCDEIDTGEADSPGYKARATPQYMTYCVVFEKNEDQQPMSEILNPYEFRLYKGLWEELKGFYVSGLKRCPESVFDYKKGSDFVVFRGKNGFRFDKLDPAPIFDVEPDKFDEYIAKLEKAMKQPKVTIPTEEQLEVFAAKLEDSAASDHGGGDRDSRRSRRRYDEDDGRGGDQPVRSRSRRPMDDDEQEAPRARRRPADEDEVPMNFPKKQRPEAEEQEAPRPRNRRTEESEPEPEEVPRNRRTASEEDEKERPVRQNRAQETDEEEAPRRRTPAAAEEEKEAPRRRAVAQEDPEPSAEAEPEPEAEAEPEPEERPASRLPNQGRERLAPTENRLRAAATHKPEEEEDTLPDDDKDNVKPASRLPARNGDEAEDPPPAVTRKGGTMGSAIRDRITKLQSRGV